MSCTASRILPILLWLASMSAGAASVTMELDADSSRIVVANTSARVVCVAVHEQDFLTRAEWGPEADCAGARQVAPGQAIYIALGASDFVPSGVAVVSWWFRGEVHVEGHRQFSASRARQHDASGAHARSAPEHRRVSYK